MKFVKGYRIVDIPLLENNGAVHSVFLKEHSDRSNKDSNGRILFVGNVDYRLNMTPVAIDEYLRMLLSRFGEINSISVSAFSPEDTANSRFAHVEFAKKASLKLALNTTDDEYSEAGLQVVESFGIDRVIQLKSSTDIRKMFQFIDENPEELLADVNSYMRDFEENELIARMEREKALNEADEDGFMPVKNRNKRKRVVEERRGSGHQRSRTKKKNTELKNFYRFQIRDDKMKQLDTLRKKFDEDRERVAKMKEARKFKPF